MSIPKEHVHIPFLTPWIDFVGILGFQSMALRNQTPAVYSSHIQGRLIYSKRIYNKMLIFFTAIV